jgi:hypothetical protein
LQCRRFSHSNTTPVVYIYLDRLQRWLFGEKQSAASGDVQLTPAE